MTLIAIFATLSETSAALSLPFLDEENKAIYIWFLISFPFYLLFLFFATLNFNYRSLYAPSDFEKGEHFIKVMDNTERSGNAQGPHDEIDLPATLSVHPPIRLPVSMKNLHIIDARRMNKKNEFRTLLEKLRRPMGNSPHVIVFLVVGESETLLKESALKFCRNAKKRSSTTFCIAYNLSSHDVTVIDQYCRADTQQAVAL